MKMSKVTGLILLAVTGLSQAQDDAPVTDALRIGWYAAPMFSVLKADKDRLTDDGDGYTLAIGYRWDFASVELNGEYLTASRNDSSPDDETRLRGGSVNALIHPFGALRIVNNLYGLIGYGAHNRQNHPGFTRDDKTFYVDVGLGYAYPFEVFGWDFAARAEGKYRLDTQQPPFEADTPREFEDWVYNVGLYVPLSRKPKPVPEPLPEPVAVVATVDTDADKDGVQDASDQCPGSAAGTVVNAQGCAPAAAAAPAPLVLTGVNFEINSDLLIESSKSVLDAIAKDLLAKPAQKNEIGGHTDSVGDDTLNLDLSQRRAESARAYLIEQGVNADNLIAVGYGETEPLDTNASAEGRAKNRRVELKVLE